MIEKKLGEGQEPVEEAGHRVPADSGLFRRWVPAAMLLLAGLTLALIGIAAGVILGLWPVR